MKDTINSACGIYEAMKDYSIADDYLTYENGNKMIAYNRNNSIYIGGCLNQDYNGDGKMLFSDGSRYEGKWSQDYAHGYGKYIFPNGDMYIGEWSNNQALGEGTYSFNGGRSITTSFFNGKDLSTFKDCQQPFLKFLEQEAKSQNTIMKCLNEYFSPKPGSWEECKMIIQNLGYGSYLNNLEDIANNIEHIIQNDFATIVKQTINNHLHKYYNIQDNNFVESSLYKNVIEYLQSSLHNVKLQYQHNSIKLDPKLENLIQSHIYNNYEQMVESFAEKYPNVPYHIPNHNLTTSDKIHFLDFENNEYTIPAIEILEQKRQGKQKLDIVTSGITELFYNYFNDVQQNELNIVLATFGKKISYQDLSNKLIQENLDASEHEIISFVDKELATYYLTQTHNYLKNKYKIDKDQIGHGAKIMEKVPSQPKISIDYQKITIPEIDQAYQQYRLEFVDQVFNQYYDHLSQIKLQNYISLPNEAQILSHFQNNNVNDVTNILVRDLERNLGQLKDLTSEFNKAHDEVNDLLRQLEDKDQENEHLRKELDNKIFELNKLGRKYDKLNDKLTKDREHNDKKHSDIVQQFDQQKIQLKAQEEECQMLKQELDKQAVLEQEIIYTKKQIAELKQKAKEPQYKIGRAHV